MISMTSILVLRHTSLVLTIIAILYAGFLLALTNEWIQRNALYAHKISTKWLPAHDLNSPERFGYSKNQVTPFYIETPDHESLYAWHILPLTLYSRNEATLITRPQGLASSFTQTEAFRLLANDPEARLVINFHGNAGHVAQGWRTDNYRALSTGASDKIHVLTADYRGFGHSSGTPTEEGLVVDGVALVDWALTVAKIPPHRIVLVGQSLGTAVATAVAESFILRETPIEFAGLVLVAGFSDLPTLLLTYRIGGTLPILSPLRVNPRLQRWITSFLKDKWITHARLANIAKRSMGLRLYILHSTSDADIPWEHSNALFYAAANASTQNGLTRAQIDEARLHLDFEEAGWVNIWKAKNITVRQEVLLHGGHNRIITYTPVALAVLRALDL